jgi:hypothetical protein
MVLFLLCAPSAANDMIAICSPRAWAPLVRDAPYSTRFVCRKNSGPASSGSSGRAFRDSSGRRCEETFDAEGSPLFRIIDDVVAQKVYIVDPATGDVETDSYHGPGQTGWGFRQTGPVETGRKAMFHGVECLHFELTALDAAHSGKNAGETWLSKKLGIVMKDVNLIEGTTFEITEIDFGEPSKELFEVG